MILIKITMTAIISRTWINPPTVNEVTIPRSQRIMRIVDEYRKRKRKPTSLDTLTDEGFSPSTDNSEELFNTIDRKVAIILIKKLPDIYREIVHMRYVQDLSLKEMSEITGQSENTLSVRVHRGVHKLRVLYMER